MEISVKKPVADSTYLEFFGLSQLPFGPISDSEHLFQTEQYSLLMEHLVNATKCTDSLVAICGADGSGKSTLIDRYVSSLDDSTYSVFIDETCDSESQFYNAFLTQIGFTEITGTAVELKNITKEFLVCRGIARDHVLIMVDNAHQTAPIILEQLRWISEIKIKDRRVLSVVLTGNADLVHVINAPTVSQIKFGSQVIFNLRKYSGEETANYVRHGLRSVGGSDAVKLAKEANSLIHRYSGGNPQQINGLCNDMLAEAYRLETRVIGEKVVRTVADKQGLLPHVTPLHGKGRRKNDPDFETLKSVPKTLEAIASEEAPTSISVDDSVPAIVDLGREDLLRQLSKLAERMEDLRADKDRALQDIDARNQDTAKLRDELDTKSVEVEKLTHTLAVNAEEITRLNLHFSRNSSALQASEDRSKILDADLAQEIRAKEEAENQLAIAAAAAEELGHEKDKLQATVNELKADERDVKNDVLEKDKDTADLKDEVKAKTRELNSLRDELASQKEILAKLEHEIGARELAENDLASATTTIKALSESKHEMQAIINELKADLEAGLKAADERGVEIEAQAKIAADLNDELEGKTGDLSSLQEVLVSRDEVLADLESQLEASQKACRSLRGRASAVSIGEDTAAEEVVDLKDELNSLRDELASKEGTLAKLEHEMGARELAENDLASATATVEELSQSKHELQATIDELKANFEAALRAAEERAVEIEAHAKIAADLNDDLEGKSGDLSSLQEVLVSRDEALADLKKQLEASQQEGKSLRGRASVLSFDEETAAEIAATDSTYDARIYSSQVVAKFEQSIENIRAYQALRQYQPESYDDLVTTYRTLIRQDRTEKQASDALRAKQAKIAELLLPKTSDETIISYARMIIDQLDDFQIDGCEPCLTLLVPKTSPDDDAPPVYSESTKERELNTLDMALRSYDANKTVPTEPEVWPDLQPIFEKLFKSFGVDNVAALQNSYDPNIDRTLVCIVSKALYSRVLKLPKPKAANALRWLLSD